MGTRCADHVTPLYPQKLALTSPTGGGRSVGTVRVRTKATEFSFSVYIKQLVSNTKNSKVCLELSKSAGKYASYNIWPLFQIRSPYGSVDETAD